MNSVPESPRSQQRYRRAGALHNKICCYCRTVNDALDYRLRVSIGIGFDEGGLDAVQEAVCQVCGRGRNLGAPHPAMPV